MGAHAEGALVAARRGGELRDQARGLCTIDGRGYPDPAPPPRALIWPFRFGCLVGVGLTTEAAIALPGLLLM